MQATDCSLHRKAGYNHGSARIGLALPTISAAHMLHSTDSFHIHRFHHSAFRDEGKENEYCVYC